MKLMEIHWRLIWPKVWRLAPRGIGWISALVETSYSNGFVVAALCPSGRAEQKSQLVVSLVPKRHKYAGICRVVHNLRSVYHRERFKGVDLYGGAVQKSPCVLC